MAILLGNVNGHLRATFAHLNAASRTEAVATAIRLGLVGRETSLASRTHAA